VYITSPKYGTLRRQGVVRFVHAFTAKGTAGVDASRLLQTKLAVDESAMGADTDAAISDSSRKLARKRSLLTEEDVAAATGGAAEILCAMRGRLIGSVPVPAGVKPSAAAVGNAIATVAKKTFATPNIAIIVSEEGIRIIDETTQDQINAVVYEQITLVAAVTKSSQLKPLEGKVTKWRKAVLGLMHVGSTGRGECELLSVGPKCLALVAAISAAHGAAKAKTTKATQAAKTGGKQVGPFAAVSSEVVNVEGPLAPLQLDRTKLVATIPLGQGQFGEVSVVQWRFACSCSSCASCASCATVARVLIFLSTHCCPMICLVKDASRAAGTGRDGYERHRPHPPGLQAAPSGVVHRRPADVSRRVGGEPALRTPEPGVIGARLHRSPAVDRSA
jgi:hypothetical protein